MSEIPTRLIAASAEHESFRRALLNVFKDFQGMGSIEQLAILSSLVGQLVAMQDQRRYTAEALMELVASNIELGNKTVISQLHKTEGQA